MNTTPPVWAAAPVLHHIAPDDRYVHEKSVLCPCGPNWPLGYRLGADWYAVVHHVLVDPTGGSA